MTSEARSGAKSGIQLRNPAGFASLVFQACETSQSGLLSEPMTQTVNGIRNRQRAGRRKEERVEGQSGSGSGYFRDDRDEGKQYAR